MKYSLFTIFLLCCITLHAQKVTVSGVVVNRFNEPMSGAYVLNESGKRISDSTDATGAFRFRANVGDIFGVEKKGFELVFNTVEANRKYRVKLDLKVQEIESIVITRQNSEEALDIPSVNIIDYQPLDEIILTLKKKKRTYYLGMDSLRQEGPSYALNINRPRELFFDCLKNAYVVSEDSAHQFVLLDSGLVMLSAVPISMFNRYIRPCVSNFDNRLVYEKFTRLQKEYTLTMHSRMPAKQVFHKFDIIGYQGAYEASLAIGKMVDPLEGDTLTDPFYLATKQRRDIYGRHDSEGAFKAAIFAQKVIEAKETAKARATVVESPNVSLIPPVMSGARTSSWTKSSGKSFAEAMAAYILLAQPLDIRTFQVQDYSVVVDYDSNTVHVLDHFGFKINDSYFFVAGNVASVLQDKSTGELYVHTQDDRNHKVFSLDPFTGNTKYIKNFGGMPNARQLVIYDGYLYYKILDRDFFGLNRVKLPNSSSL